MSEVHVFENKKIQPLQKSKPILLFLRLLRDHYQDLLDIRTCVTSFPIVIMGNDVKVKTSLFYDPRRKGIGRIFNNGEHDIVNCAALMIIKAFDKSLEIRSDSLTVYTSSIRWSGLLRVGKRVLIDKRDDNNWFVAALMLNQLWGFKTRFYAADRPKSTDYGVFVDLTFKIQPPFEILED